MRPLLPALKPASIAVRSLLALLLLCVLAASSSAAVENFTATLDGDQVVPGPVSTAASGSGTLQYDTVTKMLDFEISFQDLSSILNGVHIHGPAGVGDQAPLLFPLPTMNPSVGSIGPLNASQESDLRRGLWYINIHTESHYSGELRGQIMSASVPTGKDSWGAVKASFLPK